MLQRIFLDRYWHNERLCLRSLTSHINIYVFECARLASQRTHDAIYCASRLQFVHIRRVFYASGKSLRGLKFERPVRHGAILQLPCPFRPSVYTFVTDISAFTGTNDLIFGILLWHNDLYRVSSFQGLG